MFLINSRQGFFSCGPTCVGQALYRRYGRFFAEFLGDISLVRLGLLDLTTCVGLRYGLHIFNLRSFSWKRALQTLQNRSSKLLYCLNFVLKQVMRIFLHNIFTTQTSNPIMCFAYYTPSLHRNIYRSRNINRESIGCDFRHLLRTD